MPAKIYYDNDADLSLLKGKTIAIIGYGSQGHAQAQNLRDSGCTVIVGQRPGSPNYDLAVSHGFKPVSAEELTKAKNYIALGFPSEFETIQDLASHIEEMIIYKLPDDYFARYVANIQGVTAAAVQKAAATYIQPGKFAVVIAGDRKAIETGVRALKVGTVRVLSVEEAIGS